MSTPDWDEHFTSLQHAIWHLRYGNQLQDQYDIEAIRILQLILWKRRNEAPQVTR